MQPNTKASFSGEENQREQANRALAYQAACESAVLLRNEGVLPFKGTRIAAFGAGVSRTVKGGSGSGEVNERHSVSILEGLEDRGFEVMTKAWIGDFEAAYEDAWAKFQKWRVSPVKMLASSGRPAAFRGPEGRTVTKKDIADSCTENCIYVLSRQAGEGSDRSLDKGDYRLTDRELKDIRFCAANYKYFALLINCGSLVDMEQLEEIPGLGAILYLSQLGMEGGRAVADLLSGAVAPCGKLADSWARRYDDLPFAQEYSRLNGNLEHEYYKEGIFVGYRFFDSFGVTPAFPFGFGLGYTNFRLGRAALSLEGGTVTVRLKVRNSGRQYDGRETVQIYVSAPEGGLNKEVQRLVAFEKTGLLGPGESEELALNFPLKRLASYRFEDACFVLEAGDYVVRVGTSSRDTVPAGILRLEQELIVSRHAHICPLKAPFLELKAPKRPVAQLGAALPVLPVGPEQVETEVCSYEPVPLCPDQRVREFVDTLSVREMAEIVVGVGVFGGERRFDLPGAVGCTTSAFWDRGLVNLALCDGPAGLRVNQRSALAADGKIRPLDLSMSAYERLPKPVKDRMKGDPEKDRPLYQFATAFPVESALAQSWDRTLLEEIGEAVRTEMKEYGCTFWLAPAVNIHRNPLCGRNFEYFSEDPFLSGSLAAALTRGVQKEPGFYVTVKHFACNNQEDNRSKVSSELTERTLRELYLPAFEIAVREGGAKGVMTSYNQVNGVYTPNSYDLCTKVLRQEWGFEGVVMTDWYATLSARNGSALAMAAGNDLIMPGGILSKAGILAAVRKGLISREDVKRCCCRVVKAILDSAAQRELLS